MLNLEAFSAVADRPETFDGEVFYRDWTERYFGEEVAVFAVQSMKKLHEVQFGKISCVQHLDEIKWVIAYLIYRDSGGHGESAESNNYERVSGNFEHVGKRIEILQQAHAKAAKGQGIIGSDDTFYRDYILLPVNLYLDLLIFEEWLNELAFLKKTFEETGNKNKLQQALQLIEIARSDLETMYNRSLEGDKNPRWKSWYNPAKRRPNNGFPTKKC